ncbi:GxxExxY protein [Geoalkalibacter sp.]|uniref:GxxExxY protein n=1 Tax=Geoalkalibacter sp. TaxID=3041440 RepID=UPI00272DEB83|nr:GxxExxY protein [Geoalkalibacter sp.]
MNAEKAGFSGLEFKHKQLTDSVICCFYNVFNALGYGFLEKVYENALLIELETIGLRAVSQCPVSVLYQGKTVGDYFVDILVEDKVVVEIKAVRNLVLPQNLWVNCIPGLRGMRG